MKPTTTAGQGKGSALMGPIRILGRADGQEAVPAPPMAYPIGPFTEADLVTNMPVAGNTFVGPGGSAQTIGVTMPKAGSLVGISVDANDTWTTAPPLISAFLNGVVSLGVTPTVSTSNAQRFQDDLSSFVYSAGDILTVKYSSGTTLAPETVEATVFIWVI